MKTLVLTRCSTINADNFEKGGLPILASAASPPCTMLIRFVLTETRITPQRDRSATLLPDSNQALATPARTPQPKWTNRRPTGQIARSPWLPLPEICHPYPLGRLGVITQGKSRMR